MYRKATAEKTTTKKTTAKKTAAKRFCSIKKSAFGYSLIIRPDGSIEVEDSCGQTIKSKGRKSLPPIKKIVNTRTLTIVEAKGSEWIWIDPPGLWFPIKR
jgi:predicted component of viral defense system (DUF524 family)